MKNRLKILELQNDVSEGYFRIMLEAGLVKHDPSSLIPENDDSLLFTNSTIVPLKQRFLAEQYLGNGWFLLQDCIRLQALKITYDMEKPIKFVSCFKMLGSIVPSKNLKLAIETSLDFLFNVVGLSKQDLVVWENESGDGVLSGIFSSMDISIEKKPAYVWNYGMPGVYGTGITFARRYPDGSSKSFGNMVGMHHNGKVTAYEFGFGIESLIGRAIFCETAFSGSVHLAIAGLEPSQTNFRLVNLVGLVVAMHVAGVNKRDQRARWFFLSNSIRALINLSLCSGVSFDQLVQWLRDFAEHFFQSNISNVFVEHLEKRWMDVASAEDRFANWLKSQQSLYYRTGKVGAKFEKVEDVVSHIHKSYQIPRYRILEMLTQFQPWSTKMGQA